MALKFLSCGYNAQRLRDVHLFIVSLYGNGDVAQLGEHNAGSVGVRGSNPLISSNILASPKFCGAGRERIVESGKVSLPRSACGLLSTLCFLVLIEGINEPKI